MYDKILSHRGYMKTSFMGELSDNNSKDIPSHRILDRTSTLAGTECKILFSQNIQHTIVDIFHIFQTIHSIQLYTQRHNCFLLGGRQLYIGGSCYRLDQSTYHSCQ